MSEPSPLFDETATFTEQVQPLVRRIYEICTAAGIPCLLAFHAKTDDDGALLSVTQVLPEMRPASVKLVTSAAILSSSTSVRLALRLALDLAGLMGGADKAKN